MANELKASYNASATVYGVIRRISDGYVWNGSTFAAWVDGSIGNYDIPLVSQGGDFYAANWPSAMAAGSYRVFYYVQAGASPAITDTLLDSENRTWNGETAAVDSDVDLDTYALSTVDSFKRFQRITGTDDDTLITELINGVSAEIERVTGIQFKARNRREWYTGNHQKRLTLNYYPVLNLTRLSYGWATAMTVSYSGSAIRAEVGVSPTGVRLNSVATSGTVATSDLLFTDYPTVSLMATAIGAVSGWTASVTTNMPSADLCPFGGSDAKSQPVFLAYPDRGDLRYRVDYDAATVELEQCFPWGNQGRQHYGYPTGYESTAVFPHAFKNILVEYRAGFETIPADVTMLCNKLVSDVYFTTGIDRTLSKIALGPFAWTANQQQTDDIRSSLSAYIDVSKTIGGL
jgi:hypothetical protein